MTSEWDEHAASWDDDTAAQAYAAAAFESLTTLLANASGRTLAGLSVLDFGCGTGLLTEKIAPRATSVTAIDTSTAMLDVLRRKIDTHGWSNVETDTTLPQRGQGFDLIVCSSVCSFLADYPATAAELVALLRDGGTFVQWDWELDPAEDDPHGLTRTQITDALRSAGLRSVEVDVGFRIPFGDMEMAPLMGRGIR